MNSDGVLETGDFVYCLEPRCVLLVVRDPPGTPSDFRLGVIVATASEYPLGTTHYLPKNLHDEEPECRLATSDDFDGMDLPKYGKGKGDLVVYKHRESSTSFRHPVLALRTGLSGWPTIILQSSYTSQCGQLITNTNWEPTDEEYEIPA